MMNDDQMTPEAWRLHAALEAAGFAGSVTLSAGTAAVASPSRLATEWAGFHVHAISSSISSSTPSSTSIPTSSSPSSLQPSPSRAFYAKVLYDDMRELIDVRTSAQASQAAARAGVAPEVVMVDVARGVLMFDALPAPGWRPARVDDLARPDRLATLWELKRRLHRSVAARSEPGRVRDIADDLRAMRARCVRDGVVLPETAEWIDSCVDLACGALRATTDPAARVPVQGDGVASNVMIDSTGQLRLIDFDRGGDADPWYDVATTLNELFQFEDEWRAGIVAWSGACAEADYARCRLYALVDDWFWTLSASWSGVTSRRALEFTKLGQWTFLRTQQAVLDARFESWLRLIRGATS